jgi:hypothetical protein
MLCDDRPDYSMTGFFRLRFSQRLDFNAMKAAIQATLARHPLLRSKVRRDAHKRLSWEPVATDSIPFRQWSADSQTEYPAAEYVDLTQSAGTRIWLVDRNGAHVQFVPLDGWEPKTESPATVTARDLATTLHIRPTGNLHTNWAGLSEKWLYSDNRWVFITPDGSVYSAPSGKVAEATILAQLDNQHYANLDLLIAPPALQRTRIRFNAFDEQQLLNVPLVPGSLGALDDLFGTWSQLGL